MLRFLSEVTCLLMLIPSWGLYWLSCDRRYGQLAGSGCHPYNVVGFFLVIIAANFYYVGSELKGGRSVVFANYAILNLAEVLAGSIFYITMAGAILAGVFLAHVFGPHSHSPQPEPRSQRLLATRVVPEAVLLVGSLTAAGIAAVFVVIESLSHGALFFVAANRTLFFRANPLLDIAYTTLAPAFLVFAAKIRSSIGWISIALLCAVLSLPSGSRSVLMYLAISSATIFAIRYRRVPLWTLYVFAPAIFLAVILLRYLREFSWRGSFAEYVELRGGSLFFGGTDFQLAQPIILAANIQIIPRYPLESFLGMLLAPIPRSMISWKPEGASSLFTQLMDPIRWQLARSELLVTGFSNLAADFGLIGAVLIQILLAYVWAMIALKAVRISAPRAILAVSCCTISAYVFIRGDLYNLALFIWPLFLVVATVWVIRKCFDLGRSTVRRRIRAA